MATRRVGIDREKQFKRQQAWEKENYERIALNVPKGTRDKWKALAAAEGKSLTEWIIERVSRD